MTALPGWCTDRAILRELGLKLETVRRFGETARWVSCRKCGEGLIALSCTDCAWSLEMYCSALAHLAGLRRLNPLYLFACTNVCNRALIESPPAALLQAQAAEAAVQGVERPLARTRKARVAP